MHVTSAVISAVLIGACSQCTSMQAHASTAHTDVHAPTAELVRNNVVSETELPGATSTTASVRRSHHQHQDIPCDGGHSRLSKRVREMEPAHIEAVLSRYAGKSPPPANLAQGVAHWDPPKAAMALLLGTPGERPGEDILSSSTNHRYGPALGLPALREALIRKLERENRLDMTGQEVMVTAGGNQAFAMVALAVLDPGDHVLLVRPFYCAHQCAVQLAGGDVVESGWDPFTLLPDMDQLRRKIERGVKMVVITTPGNPTGAVCSQEMMEEIAALCETHGVWLVVDEAYEHFLYDGARHYSPCGNRLGCRNNIIHLYTMSKSFGMAGWRVGYVVYPSWASDDMVKIQDTLPTHACTASQRIALAALEGEGRSLLLGNMWSASGTGGLRADAIVWEAASTKIVCSSCGVLLHQLGGQRAGCNWTRSKVSSLSRCREAMWAAVKDMGGAKGQGAFYLLVPVPIPEDRAIDVLARQWGVLVTPGRAFGAPGHVRVSYGSLPERECLVAIERLAKGLQSLTIGAVKPVAVTPSLEDEKEADKLS